jgi:hypothetical protein
MYDYLESGVFPRPVWGDLPVVRIPYPNTGIQTSRSYLLAIKSDSINLAEMTRQCAQALALGNTPYLRCRVIATTYNNIAVDF